MLLYYYKRYCSMVVDSSNKKKHKRRSKRNNNINNNVDINSYVDDKDVKVSDEIKCDDVSNNKKNFSYLYLIFIYMLFLSLFLLFPKINLYGDEIVVLSYIAPVPSLNITNSGAFSAAVIGPFEIGVSGVE